MRPMSRILTLLLAQVGGDLGRGLGEWIGEHCEDPGQALPGAVQRAQDASWQVLELALAGDSLGKRFRVALGAAQVRGVLAPVEQLLQAQGPRLRERCLSELRQARDAGLLGAEPGRLPADESAALRRFDDPQAFIQAAWGLMADLAQTLREAGLTNLAELLGSATPERPPLLVTTFGYFLRRELAADPLLAADLNFDLLQRVWQGQEQGLDALRDGLAQWGGALHQELERVAGTLTAVQARVGEAFEAVLDLQRFIDDAQGEQRDLARQVLATLERLGAARGAVTPGLSCSLHGETERQLVRALIARYRALPAAQQVQVPALLNGLGKLELAAGEPRAAQRLFDELAQRVPSDPAAQAEARYNQFRAALEARDWPGALAPLRAAASLDPERFAPFPLRKYDLIEILGAGGFGVAFLCRHRHIDTRVVIKSLYADDQGQGIARIFREGQLLKGVNHPAVVRVDDCDYADAQGQRRPYLVMEHCPGQSLEAWLTAHGDMGVPDLLDLAQPLAAGMAAAHARGVLHRDLKPDNLLVHRDGGWHLKIIDFGLALRQAPGDPVAARTASGGSPPATVGTVQFAPPEQLGRRPEPVGPYSDIYAFGKTLVYCLFRRTELLRRDWRHLEQTEPGLAELIERCLEDDPARRLQDFGAVTQTLTEIQSRRRPDGAAPRRDAPASTPVTAAAPASQAPPPPQAPSKPAASRIPRPLAPHRDAPGAPPVTAAAPASQAASKPAEPSSRGPRVRPASMPESDAAPGPLTLSERAAPSSRQPPPPALPSFRDRLRDGSQGPEMVWLPAGSFLMGSADGDTMAFGDERPRHEVRFAQSFAIGRYPVTFEDFDRFRAAPTARASGGPGWLRRLAHSIGVVGRDGAQDQGWGRGRRPVIDVSWDDAVAYCVWLSAQTGRTYRLPSEAEWEYACRGGTETRWSFGDQEEALGDHAWFRENADGKTHPVGEKRPNPWGLHDLHGNVWEWVQDHWHENYQGAPADGSPWEDAAGRGRVARGGGWFGRARYCRSARRYPGGPADRSDRLGFRLARGPKPGQDEASR